MVLPGEAEKHVFLTKNLRICQKIKKILAGRAHAVNREFVYIDFDDERFPPCERVGGSDQGSFLRFFKGWDQK